MQATEQTEFQGHVARLFAGFGIPATEERQAAFWTAFMGLSLLEFSRMVDHALSENGLKGEPDVPAMWALRASMKAAAADGGRDGAGVDRDQFRVEAGQLDVYDLRVPAQGGRALHRRHQYGRAPAEVSRGGPDWIDGMKAEDVLPTLPECMTAFGNAMKQVADVVDSRELVDG
jgi:hypothetical protein